MIYIRHAAIGFGSLGYTIERLSDSTFFDGTKFSALPSNPTSPIALTQGSGIYGSVYSGGVNADPVVFPSGEYCVYIHRMDNNQVVACYLIDYSQIQVFLVGGAIGSR